MPLEEIFRLECVLVFECPSTMEAICNLAFFKDDGVFFIVMFINLWSIANLPPPKVIYF